VTSILIATTNPGKTREILATLAPVPQRFVTLADHRGVPEPEETESTFAGNARLKALYYAARTGLPTVAEDSGLVIDALGGRPGVESARYPGATYADKFANLYRELAPHPRPWTARFICALAFVAGEPPIAGRPLEFAAEGRVEGEIAPGPKGPHGFGYDPIFYYPRYGHTLGEVDDARKLAVSHRGEAFRQFRDWLMDRNWAPGPSPSTRRV
jgi:XTP/dITP diphosphohydrolase